MKVHHENRKIVIKDKVITALDEFVLDFTRILKKYTDYVVVSGYVVILFGRARGTEDIDTIIKYMDKSAFLSFYQDLKENRYYFLNPEDADGLYEMLEEGLGIRAAREDTIIPNVELKFDKDDFDRYSIENRVTVFIDQSHVCVSPVELQIPYKLYLRSDKDIEDAVYLWDIFKETANIPLLKKFMKALHVTGDPYGIEV
ncbi:MAG: hypothetical protein HXS46_11275 [Theionarchaea archaeon]|nr:MAG: hypothetical protein AYK18_01945 [Theionarchaea archaeon DG-70]MBU7011263.1 hypothetical protein [Theionarchaea archaeon]